MEKLIILVLLGAVLYFIFFRKKEKNEITVRLEKFDKNQDNNITDEIEAEYDDYNDFESYKSEEIPAIGRYLIKYLDSRGKRTEREINVMRAYDNNGILAVAGHCSLRDSYRTFVDSRVQNAINLENGEVVKSLAKDAIEQYAKSPKGRIEAAIDKENCAIGILLYIAKADNRMNKAERDIISEYLTESCPEILPIKDHIDATIKKLMQPEAKEYKLLIKDLKNAGEIETLQKMLLLGERIVSTQKTIDPDEVAALQHIKNAIKI